ncbi:MAG: AbrB/MazE/SpoVT family DNA-binding domain-containing protein [Vicinamibacteria bacterium]
MASGDKTLLLSERGQITLPADVRKRLGLKGGGVLTLEERRGELVLKPAAVVELEMYSDEDIARWDEDDELSNEDRRRLSRRLRKIKR